MKTITINIPDDCEVQIVRKEEIKEKEKTEPIIRTYQDLIDSKKRITGYWSNADCIVKKWNFNNCFDTNTKDIATTEKIVKSTMAIAMISQLMPYYGGVITDEEWDNGSVTKYIIYKSRGEICSNSIVTYIYQYLAFHTEKQRDDFLKYNERLVKDYLMID